MRLKDKARFWAKVDVREPDECWPWTAGTDEHGYGAFWLGGRMQRAHRVAFIASYWHRRTGRDLPADITICHRCDNPPCCNPTHLFAGTQQDNLADMGEKGRRAGPKGERSATSRLTDAQVLDIRRAYRGAGKPGRKRADDGSPSVRQLARTYGVGPTTISNVLAGRSWGHLG